MASHLASLWRWDFLELGNGLINLFRVTSGMWFHQAEVWHFLASGIHGCHSYSALQTCCKRWYFTFNSKECSKPAPIDGIVYHGVDINIHRSTNIEGYCGGIPAGKVQVGFNVGDCTGSGYKAGDAWTSWYQTIRIIIEEVEPPVA